MYIIGYGNSKVSAANGLDFYVDDDLDNLKPLIGVVLHLFLFSWGYNAHVEVGDVVKHLASWKELYRTIQILGGVR